MGQGGRGGQSAIIFIFFLLVTQNNFLLRRGGSECVGVGPKGKEIKEKVCMRKGVTHRQSIVRPLPDEAVA